MHGRTIHRHVFFPDSQQIGNRERLAVPNDHADDFAARHPRAHFRLNAHLREADLIARAVRMDVRAHRQHPFMRSPAHLRRGDAFFVKAFDAPRIDKFVDFFRAIRDLRVPLADVNDLHACQLGDFGEIFGAQRVLQLVGARIVRFFRQQFQRDVAQAFFRKMRHQARIRAMIHNRRDAFFRPLPQLPAQFHLPRVQRPMNRRDVRRVFVRLPFFHRGIDVHDLMRMTPFQNFRTVNIIRDINDKIAPADEFRELRMQVFPCNSINHVMHSGLQHVGNAGAIIHEVHHRNLFRRRGHVPKQQRQKALRDGAAANH